MYAGSSWRLVTYSMLFGAAGYHLVTVGDELNKPSTIWCDSRVAVRVACGSTCGCITRFHDFSPDFWFPGWFQLISAHVAFSLRGNLFNLQENTDLTGLISDFTRQGVRDFKKCRTPRPLITSSATADSVALCVCVWDGGGVVLCVLCFTQQHVTNLSRSNQNQLLPLSNWQQNVQQTLWKVTRCFDSWYKFRSSPRRVQKYLNQVGQSPNVIIRLEKVVHSGLSTHTIIKVIL